MVAWKQDGIRPKPRPRNRREKGGKGENEGHDKSRRWPGWKDELRGHGEHRKALQPSLFQSGGRADGVLRWRILNKGSDIPQVD